MSPARPLPLVCLDLPTAETLRRCYPGEPPAAVLARAVRMLATADGHLDAGGRIKRGAGGRREVRRTP
jgi:hypothetical protein